MILLILQYLGSVFILLATCLRSMPRFITSSFMCSSIGSLMLGLYSFTTNQFGFLVLNFMSVLMAAWGLHNWGKLNTNKKKVTKK